MATRPTVGKAELRRHKEELSRILTGFALALDKTCRAFNANRKVDPFTQDDRKAIGPKGTLFRFISEGLKGELTEQEIAELLRIRSVLAFIRGLETPVDELAACVNRKIDEHVLFSDKAVREVNDLLGKSRFLVQACADGVLTESPILKAHVICGVNFLFEVLEAYADEHQKRLVGAMCRPQASIIYLDMHEAFRGMLHHLKEITRHISAEVELETWACPLDKPTS